MQAYLVKLNNPFRPTVDREVSTIRPGRTLRRVLKESGDFVKGRRTRPFVVLVNGKPILQRYWKNVRLQENDLVTVATLPRGGGGSNPLQIIAMIAVIALSVYTAGAVGAAYGAAWGAAAGAAVSLAGTLLLNMIFPPPKAGLTTVSADSVSPNYSLTASGNTARLLESIPVLYGRFKCTPDYGAQPYTEIQGNDQYLYQLYCVTQGYADIQPSDIYIGDTPIGNFPDVTVQVYHPYEQPSLFPTNVVTSTSVSGQTLFAPNETGAGVVGPFILGAPGSNTNFLSVDISLPSGLLHVSDQGKYESVTVNWIVEYAKVNDSGGQIGDWVTLWNGSATSNSSQPLRFTQKVAVPGGRYMVRAQRISPHNSDGRQTDTITWDNARAYLDENTAYGNVTMIAVVMKASNVLNSSTAHSLTCIAQRRLRKWDPVNGWSQEVATSNPAWAAADAITNATYGRNLPDSRYNLNELYRLAQVFDSRGDQFNGIFDTSSQFWDVLTQIVRVGRTVPMYYAGMIDFIRDEPKTIPTAMFSPQNMIQNTFTSEYQFAEVDTPDFVRITFRNQDTWEDDQVDCIPPGGTATNPSVVELIGVTNRDQAWREGITMAVRNLFQRRLISWSTELEGLLPKYGDLIRVSHDVPAWGYSGRVISLDRATGLLTTSEPLPFSDGSTHMIAFRKQDGSQDGPYVCVNANTGYDTQCIVQGDVSGIWISDGVTKEHTFYQFGPSERAGLLVQCMSITPAQDGSIAFQATNYSEQVYAAETGGILPPWSGGSNLPTPPSAPVIDYLRVEYTFDVGWQNLVASPANGASYYEFQASNNATVDSSGNVNGTWVAFPASADPTIRVQLPPGRWYIRVRGVGALKGAWRGDFYDVVATTLPAPTLDLVTTKGIVFAIQLNWVLTAATANLAQTIELWHGLSNQLGNAVRLATFGPGTTTYTHGDMGPNETHYYWMRVIDVAGRTGPWYNNGVPVVGQSSSDATDILNFLVGQITQTQLSQTLFDQIDNSKIDLTSVYAAIDDERTQRTSADEAFASEITTLTASVNGNTANVQVISQAQATTDGKLNAMWAAKVQATVDGKYYLAGIGVGIENVAGQLQSQVLVTADRFAILNTTNSGGTITSPFVVQGGVVYINTAIIADASIGLAKIGALQSSAVNDYGNPLWAFDKNGSFTMNGTGNATSGMLTMNNNQIVMYYNGIDVITISTNLS